MHEILCDLVVLGGGGSGLTAAVRAAQLSGRKVIVLEKASQTGGGMIMASTMRTFRSRWQKDRNLPDVTNHYLRKVMDATYWRLDSQLACNAILATGEFFDWFCDLAGKEIEEKFHVGRYVFDGDDGPLGPQLGGPGGITGGGRLFMDTLRAKCDDFGVKVLTRHKAVGARVENGRIAAIEAQGPKGEVLVRCQTCILATGSWINNDEILREICPQFLEARRNMGLSPHMNPNYTGDGFAIAAQADAMLDKQNYCLRLMGPMLAGKSGTVAHIGNSPFSLAVNTVGRRYACEAAEARMGVFNSGLVLMEQPEGLCFILFDKNILQAAVEYNAANDPSREPDAFGNPPMPLTLEDALADLENAGSRLYRANCLDALAAQLPVNGAELCRTVERYNRFCETGFDRDCFKDPAFLVPCSQAPFFAVRADLGTDGAFGGVKVNENMQAYRSDGSLIDGLYVTGDFASGRFINMAGVKVQLLNDMSWALASGFLAGTNACRALDR